MQLLADKQQMGTISTHIYFIWVAWMLPAAFILKCILGLFILEELCILEIIEFSASTRYIFGKFGSRMGGIFTLYNFTS